VRVPKAIVDPAEWAAPLWRRRDELGLEVAGEAGDFRTVHAQGLNRVARHARGSFGRSFDIIQYQIAETANRTEHRRDFMRESISNIRKQPEPS